MGNGYLVKPISAVFITVILLKSMCQQMPSLNTTTMLPPIKLICLQLKTYILNHYLRVPFVEKMTILPRMLFSSSLCSANIVLKLVNNSLVTEPVLFLLSKQLTHLAQHWTSQKVTLGLSSADIWQVQKQKHTRRNRTKMPQSSRGHHR